MDKTMPNDTQDDDLLKHEVNVSEMVGQITDEDFKTKFQTLDGQRQAYKNKFEKKREEFQKLEEEFKLAQEKLSSLEKPQPGNPPSKPEEDLPIREVLSLRSQGFSEKEILGLVDEAKALGIPVAKALSNETFKSGFEVKRAKERAEQNTPSPSFGGLMTGGGKRWEDLKTDDERRAAFPGLMQGARGRQNE